MLLSVTRGGGVKNLQKKIRYVICNVRTTAGVVFTWTDVQVNKMNWTCAEANPSFGGKERPIWWRNPLSGSKERHV